MTDKQINEIMALVTKCMAMVATGRTEQAVDKRAAIESALRAVPAIPEGWKLVPVCALTRWRDAFAEELSAWDIDPPIEHVQTSHDEISAMLSASPQAPQPAQPAVDATDWTEQTR